MSDDLYDARHNARQEAYEDQQESDELWRQAMKLPKIITCCVAPPVPTRAYDWCAYFESAEHGIRCWGATEREAIDNLMKEVAEDIEQLKRGNTPLSSLMGDKRLQEQYEKNKAEQTQENTRTRA